MDVTLRGEHVLSYFLKYTRQGASDEQTFVAPSVRLRASDFPVRGSDSEFRADIYVRRSDGAVARVNDATVFDHSKDDVHFFGASHVLLYFRSQDHLLYTRALWKAHEADDMQHCIHPVCEFRMLFTAADAMCRSGMNLDDPDDDELPPLRNANGNNPVCVDANATLLEHTARGRPLLQLYEGGGGGDGGGDELSNEAKLAFLTALDWP